MHTIAAIRGDDHAVVEVLSADGCVVSFGASFVTVAGEPSVDAIVQQLPGGGWVPQYECDEWITWARSQVAGSQDEQAPYL